ncbi:MAG: hypothetical protein GY842_16415 [bacterium]|nr:hypothetical protein [bacterium]
MQEVLDDLHDAETLLSRPRLGIYVFPLIGSVFLLFAVIHAWQRPTPESYRIGAYLVIASVITFACYFGFRREEAAYRHFAT